MKKAIVLCSGGLDSVTTAYYIKKKLNYENIIMLFFNYGQRTVESERKFSKICSKNLKAEFIEIKLKELNKLSTSLINSDEKTKDLTINDLKNSKEESDKYYVPMRNTLFLSYALAYAESKFAKEKKYHDIFVGFKNEGKESYPDTTKKYVNEINKLSKIASNGQFKIIAPLIKKDKEDIIILGNKLGIDYSKTHSCYSRNVHCGTCLACMLRKQGFYWANIKDPTIYLKN